MEIYGNSNDKRYIAEDRELGSERLETTAYKCAEFLSYMDS